VSNRRHFGSKCCTHHLACAIRDQRSENRGHAKIIGIDTE
jgi:hypothetical protein